MLLDYSTKIVLCCIKSCRGLYHLVLNRALAGSLDFYYAVPNFGLAGGLDLYYAVPNFGLASGLDFSLLYQILVLLVA